MIPLLKRLGAASAKIMAAASRILYNRRSMELCLQGPTRSHEIRIKHFATNQFTGGECFDAAHMLFKKTSTRGVWLNNPMQRQMRDILVASNPLPKMKTTLETCLVDNYSEQACLFPTPSALNPTSKRIKNDD